MEPRSSKEEFAEWGQAIYQRDIRPRLQATDEGKFVAVDIETGAYETDSDDYSATGRLLHHHPDAQIWLCRAGHRVAYRIAVGNY